jgi:hypothetical protein
LYNITSAKSQKIVGVWFPNPEHQRLGDQASTLKFNINYLGKSSTAFSNKLKLKKKINALHNFN